MISPWEWQAELKSPDGNLVATIADAMEIAMGGPTSGELKLSNGINREHCNPSFVWSADSRFLAVPQWTKERNQRLLIIDVVARQSRYAPGEYRVMQLESFENMVVKGVDSPIHMPRIIELDVTKIGW